jgi:4-amino-4-deoxy-L-arabinose transferase-like glycosyltransferase
MAQDHFSAPVAERGRGPGLQHGPGEVRDAVILGNPGQLAEQLAPAARPGPPTPSARPRTEGKKDWLSRLRPAAGPWPLLCVLAIQAGLSLRLVWTNTAYQDEALYLWAGRLEWAHWLHGAAVPDFATYFSGAPAFYPALAALASNLGGLAAARMLSLCCMLAATALLYAVTKHLFGRWAAVGGSVVFAAIGPTQFLGALATFDALAVLLLALASWLAVQSGQRGEKWLVCCAIAMALADAAKYTSLLWNPVVIALAVLGTAGTWPRSASRGIRLAGYTAAVILPVLFLAGGHSYLTGIMSTTLSRPGSTVPVLRVLGASAEWTGAVVFLAITGAAAVTRGRVGRCTALAWILVAALFLAPLGQARIHTNFSLFKHVGYGAWFGCIVAGCGLLALTRAVRAMQARNVTVVSVMLVFLLGVSGAVLSAAHFAAWPDSAQMIRGLAPVIGRAGCPCLVAENDVVHYYLKPAAHDTFTTIFVLRYRAGGRELSGVPAYRAAIGDHYFRLVEIDPAEMPAFYTPIVQALSASGYRLVISTASNVPGEPFEIWIRDRAR